MYPDKTPIVQFETRRRQLEASRAAKRASLAYAQPPGPTWPVRPRLTRLLRLKPGT